MKIKKRYLLLLVIIIAISGTLIHLNAQTYSYPANKDIRFRFNYLNNVIQQPLNSNNEIMQLRVENYEFALFTYAYSTYAATNICMHDSSYKKDAIALIQEAIEKSLSEEIAQPFGVNYELLESDSLPQQAVLYLGHINLMLGCYRLLNNDSTFNKLNDKISEFLFKKYSNCPFLNLESYPNLIWVPDNTVALASLKLHDDNAGSNYSIICDKWVHFAKNNLIDKKTGVLYSTLDPVTGKVLEEPRGSMLAWSIMFIYRFDEDFATELYQNYKKNFSTNYGIYRLFRERKNIYTTGMGDIDSGPLILGYSIPANEFALACAVQSGDAKTARKIERLIDHGTKEVIKENELKYEVRFIDLNISPMAEALVLYSLTVTSWRK